MKYVILFAVFILTLKGDLLFAQNKHFITSGVIEFEKTDNMFALVKKKITKSTPGLRPIYEEYLRTEPQFIKLKSTLTFNGNTTLFVPIAPQKPIDYNYDSPMADQNNIVFADLANSKSIIQKQFFEQTFLVKDSLRKIKWKLTDETRAIAGYNCRRANGIMLDSIYVVAFYTDAIHIPGGPESFNGLPGMILGVALPHENVTWFATKITETSVDAKALAPPKKGKIVNNKQLYEGLMFIIGPWGDYTTVALKGFLM